MNGRRGLALVLLAVLVSTSGCLSILTGGTTTFAASSASISDATLSETGYELASNETQTAVENVTVLGQERTIRVVNHAKLYEKSLSIPGLGEADLARFALVTTPTVQAAGQSMNPVGQFSEREVVEQFSGRVGGVRDLSHVNNRTVQSLGEDRTVEKFEGTVETDLGDVDVFVHVTKFEHEGDYVVAVSAYPQRMSDEQANVDEILRSLRH